MKKYAQNLTEKIISEHLVRGRMETGTEIFLKVDSTLVHDMSGTLAYIGFEAMGIDKIQVPAAVTFQDHNLVAMDHRSLDDHRFVASAARRYGSILSKAGNGICHSVYYSRIGRPGTVLAGADSHSATAGALGMLGVGLGGLDVSAIMGGEPMELKMPAVIGVEVKGRLKPGVSAKDAALWLLKQLSVKGGVGKVLEYFGEGVENLSVPQRATIANMGAEMGATSSVFPADEAVPEGTGPGGGLSGAGGGSRGRIQVAPDAGFEPHRALRGRSAYARPGEKRPGSRPGEGGSGLHRQLYQRLLL